MQYSNGFVYSGQWAADMPVPPQPSSLYARPQPCHGRVAVSTVLHSVGRCAVRPCLVRSWLFAGQSHVAPGSIVPPDAHDRHERRRVCHAICRMPTLFRVAFAARSRPAYNRRWYAHAAAIPSLPIVQTRRGVPPSPLRSSPQPFCSALLFADCGNATHRPDRLAVRRQATASRARTSAQASAVAGGEQAADTLVATWERGRTSGTVSTADYYEYRRLL